MTKQTNNQAGRQQGLQEQKVRLDKWLWAARFFKSRFVPFVNIRFQDALEQCTACRRCHLFAHYCMLNVPRTIIDWLFLVMAYESS